MLIPLSLILTGIIIGLLVYFYPVSVMRLQVKFYEKINWRVEPISLQKEFDRTKHTGLYLVILCVFAGAYMWYFLK